MPLAPKALLEHKRGVVVDIEHVAIRMPSATVVVVAENVQQLTERGQESKMQQLEPMPMMLMRRWQPYSLQDSGKGFF